MTPRMALITAALVLVVGGALAFFLTPTVTDRINQQSAVSAVNNAGVPTGVKPGPPGMPPIPLTTASPTATPASAPSNDTQESS